MLRQGLKNNAIKCILCPLYLKSIICTFRKDLCKESSITYAMATYTLLSADHTKVIAQ
jgi:hypothetical protein